MPLYEHIFLARQDVSPQQVESLTETLKGVIAEGGGQVGKTEYWGLKSLSFRIKKNRKAHFTLMNIEAPHAAVSELERQLRLHDDILRFLTLRLDALEEGPSAMMRSRGGRDRDRDRDDRRGRRGEGRPRDDDRPPRAEAQAPADGETAPKPAAPGPAAPGPAATSEETAS
jgi:small subunit ribosomal protein S6